MDATLKRETFETSRELEYFSEKELLAQIGHDTKFWPVAILRELIDNGLDAAELAGVPPVIDITTSGDTVTVVDNGSGIPETTIERSLDLPGAGLEQSLLREPHTRPDGQRVEGGLCHAIRRQRGR